MRETFESRFWARVAKGASEECWPWLAGTTSKGYGSLKRNTETCQAHRVAYELVYGTFTETLYVLHECDNRICVNPGHLFLGTHLDNMRDMSEKGRAPRSPGEANGNVKLKDEEVVRIRALYATGMFTQKDLGRRFNVSQSYISVLVRGLQRSR